MFDMPLLRALVAVADTGGFTRASERLNLSQSAVSAQIRRLEADAGCKLVERTTRAVALTAAGTRLAGYARTILALHADARSSVGAGKQIAGAVSVGLSEEMATPRFFTDVRRFSALQPDVEVALTIGFEGELLPKLQAGALDILVGSRCGEAAPEDMLWAEPLIWAGPPLDLPGPSHLPLSLAVFPDSCPYRAAAITALTRAGLSWRVGCQSPSFAGLILAVRAGVGVAPIPRRAAVTAGLRELAGLPDLPETQFVLALAPKPTRAALLLAAELREGIANDAAATA